MPFVFKHSCNFFCCVFVQLENRRGRHCLIDQFPAELTVTREGGTRELSHTAFLQQGGGRSLVSLCAPLTPKDGRSRVPTSPDSASLMPARSRGSAPCMSHWHQRRGSRVLATLCHYLFLPHWYWVQLEASDWDPLKQDTGRESE